MPTTRERQTFLYGVIEARMRVPTDLGCWPAFWALGAEGGWPGGGEIDMMEYYSGIFLFNVLNGHQQWEGDTLAISTLPPGWLDEFHVWTMDWDTDKIDLYLDGELNVHYPLSLADGTLGTENPFRKPMYLLFQLALGGSNGHDPSDLPFPVTLEADWVRVFQKP